MSYSMLTGSISSFYMIFHDIIMISVTFHCLKLLLQHIPLWWSCPCFQFVPSDLLLMLIEIPFPYTGSRVTWHQSGATVCIHLHFDNIHFKWPTTSHSISWHPESLEYHLKETSRLACYARRPGHMFYITAIWEIKKKMKSLRVEHFMW